MLVSPIFIEITIEKSPIPYGELEVHELYVYHKDLTHVLVKGRESDPAIYQHEAVYLVKPTTGIILAGTPGS